MEGERGGVGAYGYGYGGAEEVSKYQVSYFFCVMHQFLLEVVLLAHLVGVAGVGILIFEGIAVLLGMVTSCLEVVVFFLGTFFVELMLGMVDAPFVQIRLALKADVILDGEHGDES